MKIFKQIAIVLLSLSLFACSTTAVNSMEFKKIELSQIQKEWQLMSIDDQNVDPEINSTLNIDLQGQATGKLACNNFFGSLELKDNTLKIAKMGSTRMMCAAPINDVEMVVSSVLSDWSEIQLTENGLSLSGKLHTLNYRAE